MLRSKRASLGEAFTMAIPQSLADVSVPWLNSLLPHASVRAVFVQPLALGRGMSGQVGHVAAETATGSATYALKLPERDQWERSLREIRLLETVDLPLHAGRLVASDIDPSSRRTALLLKWADGEPGDVISGTTPDRLGQLVHDLARLHAGYRSVEALEKLDWLPRWGIGTAGAQRPHQRRVERFRSRIDPFLGEFGSLAPPWAAGLLDRIGRRLESTLGSVADLPPTLIHGDAHLDNVMFGRKSPLWLDWQSASRGPGLYDLVRLLSETVDITADLPLARQLVHCYTGHLSYHGTDALDGEQELALLPEMISVVVAGFVSGYGGERRHTLTPRERVMVANAVSPNGLFGFANHFLDVA